MREREVSHKRHKNTKGVHAIQRRAVCRGDAPVLAQRGKRQEARRERAALPPFQNRDRISVEATPPCSPKEGSLATKGTKTQKGYMPFKGEPCVETTPPCSPEDTRGFGSGGPLTSPVLRLTAGVGRWRGCLPSPVLRLTAGDWAVAGPPPFSPLPSYLSPQIDHNSPAHLPG